MSNANDNLSMLFMISFSKSKHCPMPKIFVYALDVCFQLIWALVQCQLCLSYNTKDWTVSIGCCLPCPENQTHPYFHSFVVLLCSLHLCCFGRWLWRTNDDCWLLKPLLLSLLCMHSCLVGLECNMIQGLISLTVLWESWMRKGKKNLDLIYSCNDIECVNMLRMRRAPFLSYANCLEKGTCSQMLPSLLMH